MNIQLSNLYRTKRTSLHYLFMCNTFILHIVPHFQGEDLAIVTIQDRRNVLLTVLALYLGNIGKQFGKRCFRRKVLLDQVFLFLYFHGSMGQSIRPAAWRVDPPQLDHKPQYPAKPNPESTLPKCQPHTWNTIIIIVGGLCPDLPGLTAWPPKEPHLWMASRSYACTCSNRLR